MSSSRSHQILLCEKIIVDCDALLENAAAINWQIGYRQLPITSVDLAGIRATKQAAELALRDLEIEAANS